MIRVAIADDYQVLREGLTHLLSSFEDVEVVGVADGGEAAVRVCADARPDVLLLDLVMPDLDGIGVTLQLAEVSPLTRVILFTSFVDHEAIVVALDAGAIGYLLKDAEPEELHAAIRAAAKGEAPLAPRAAAALLERRRHMQGGIHLNEEDLISLHLAIRSAIAQLQTVISVLRWRASSGTDEHLALLDRARLALESAQGLQSLAPPAPKGTDERVRLPHTSSS